MGHRNLEFGSAYENISKVDACFPNIVLINFILKDSIVI